MKDRQLAPGGALHLLHLSFSFTLFSSTHTILHPWSYVRSLSHVKSDFGHSSRWYAMSVLHTEFDRESMWPVMAYDKTRT